MAETRNQEIVRHTEILSPAAAKANQFVSLKLKRFAAIFWSDVILNDAFPVGNLRSNRLPRVNQTGSLFLVSQNRLLKVIGRPACPHDINNRLRKQMVTSIWIIFPIFVDIKYMFQARYHLRPR